VAASRIARTRAAAAGRAALSAWRLWVERRRGKRAVLAQLAEHRRHGDTRAALRGWSRAVAASRLEHAMIARCRCATQLRPIGHLFWSCFTCRIGDLDPVRRP
jgi:hypothetical protein